MSSCNIRYISDSKNGFTPDQIEDLTSKHIDVSKILYRHRYNNSDEKQQLFKYFNGRLTVTNNTEYYNQAVELIKDINTDEEIVTLITDENNPLRSYVSVDVRPLANRAIDVDQESMSNFIKNYFGDSDIIRSDDELTSAVRDNKNKEVWDKALANLTGKLATYVNSLPDTGDRFDKSRAKDLKNLLGILKDKSTSGILESLNYYITTSTHNIASLKARLGVIDSIIKDLSVDPDTKKEQLRKVSDFVRQSSYYYHLFDVLEEISGDLATLGIQNRAIDNYEVDKLEDGLKGLLEELQFTEQETLDYLNTLPAKTQDAGIMFIELKNLYKNKIGSENLTLDKIDEIEKEFDTILRDSLKKDGGLIQQLNNSLNALKPFKDRLKSLHYETLTEIYYPVLEEAYQRGTDEYKAKFPLDKERFKTMLEISEEDISKITKYGSAMINVNEVVAQTIANYFKDMMIDVNITDTKDINSSQRAIVGKNQEDLNRFYTNSVHDSYILEEVVEVDDTFIPEGNSIVVEIPMFGETRKYKARKTRNLLQEFDTLKFDNTRKVFKSLVQDKAIELATQLKADKYSLVGLKNSNDPVLRNLYKYLYYVSNDDNEYLKNTIGLALEKGELENKIKSLLTTAFNKEHFIYFTPEEYDVKFEKDGITNSGEFVNLNLESNKVIKRRVLNNSYSIAYKNGNLESIFNSNRAMLFGKTNGLTKRVLVQYNNGEFGYVDVYNVGEETVIDKNPELQIENFYNFSDKYQKLDEGKYSINASGFNQDARNKWKLINNNPQDKSLFDHFIKQYHAANDNMGDQRKRFNEVPQVSKLDESTVTQKVKSTFDNVKGLNKQAFYDYASTYLVDENKFILKDKDGNLVDAEGNPSEFPVYQTYQKQYINGQNVRTINAKFIKPIPIDNIETDLYKAITLYKTSSNLYKSLKANESQALLLQSVIEGDKTLGINKRKMKIKDLAGKNISVAGGQVSYKEHDINTSELIMSFINDYVYGINKEDYGILGSRLSAKKVASVIGGYTAFTSLAWNFLTMPSNALISLHNTRSVSKGNQWFNEKDWNESIVEYTKNVPNFMKDFGTKSLIIEKSPISQMIVRFNAIQGEFLSPTGQIVNKDVGNKILQSSLFWTQEVVEHSNQTQSMIMLMKGFKLPLKEGETEAKSLWDAIQETNQGKTGELLMPEEFTPELEKLFQKRLQAVNMVIHGNYGKLDQNMLQKGVLTNMLMMFRKYIYDGFRTRFEGERPDIQTGTIEEGYFRTYFKQLNSELAEQVKTQGLSLALTPQILKALGVSLIKSTIGGADAATFRLLSKNNQTFKDFIYGKDASLSDRQRYAAIRSTYGVGNVLRLVLIISIIQGLKEGLDEDDEAMKKMLSYAELFSRRLESDIGFFESFTSFGSGVLPGATTLDQIIKIMRDPFVAYRSVDNTVGIFKQVTSFDFVDDDGDFNLHWGIFDEYEKSGRGYEKGDLKISRKLQKSLVAPWYNTAKFFSPEDQLNMLDLLFKNSK